MPVRLPGSANMKFAWKVFCCMHPQIEVILFRLHGSVHGLYLSGCKAKAPKQVWLNINSYTLQRGVWWGLVSKYIPGLFPNPQGFLFLFLLNKKGPADGAIYFSYCSLPKKSHHLLARPFPIYIIYIMAVISIRESFSTCCLELCFNAGKMG